jgi:hypothetical protein
MALQAGLVDAAADGSDAVLKQARHTHVIRM